MRAKLLTSVTGAVILCGFVTGAHAETLTYVDLQAGLAYSTNPLLVTDENSGSSSGRISAYAFRGWSTERSATSLSAYLENSTYFRRYSNKQAFSLAANSRREVSETLRVFGDLNFSGDVGGQLSSRFYGVPSGSIVVDPTVPDSFVLVDPDLYALNQRQYRLGGQLGASLTLSPRDSLTGAIGAQKVWVGGDNNQLNYTQYDGSLNYDRQINERVTVGGRLIAQYSDYAAGRSVTSIGPQATVRARLSSEWDASAALGFVRTREESSVDGDERSSFDLALDGSLCRNLEFERICARVARRAQSSILGGSTTSTSAAFDYYRRLSAKDTVQLTASAIRSGNPRILGSDQRSTFYSLAGSYDRMLNDRLSAGANLVGRKLTAIGPDPRLDLGGSIFVRYRLGDVR
jgi:hypothetical protein